MTDKSLPGSCEEAAARRNVGKGPFRAWKDKVDLFGQGSAVPIVDSGDRPFAYVLLDDCVGGDLSAARARATRIAESLNRTEPAS